MEPQVPTLNTPSSAAPIHQENNGHRIHPASAPQGNSRPTKGLKINVICPPEHTRTQQVQGNSTRVVQQDSGGAEASCTVGSCRYKHNTLGVQTRRLSYSQGLSRQKQGKDPKGPETHTGTQHMPGTGPHSAEEVRSEPVISIQAGDTGAKAECGSTVRDY